MKKFMKIISVAAVVLTLGMIISCGSTKVESAVQGLKSNEENGVSVEVQNKLVLVDWTSRALGVPSVPGWLQGLAMGNANNFKQAFGVADNRVVKMSQQDGKSEVQATNKALAEASWALAAELSQSIEGYLAEGTGTRNQHNMDALKNFAVRVKADVVGAREETRFWQKMNLVDKDTGNKETQYVAYYVYSLDEASWERIVKKYMTDLIGELVENNVDPTFIAEVGACYSRIVNDADKKDRQQAEKELAAARASQARADAEAAKANQAAAEAQYASKKLDAESEEKVKSTQQARELMYQSFLK